MKLKYLSAILTLFLLTACTTPVKQVKQPFVWEATSGNSKIYFLGTMHIQVGLDALPSQIKGYIASSDRVFVEADIDSYKKIKNSKRKSFFKEYFKKAFEPDPGSHLKLSKKARANVRYMLKQPDVKEFIKGLGVKFDSSKASLILAEIVYTDFVIGKGRIFSLPKEMVDTFGEINTHYDARKALASKTILDDEVSQLAKKKSIPLFTLDSESFLRSHANKDIQGTSHEKFALKRIEYLFGGGLKKDVSYMVSLGELIKVYYSGNMELMSRILVGRKDSEYQKEMIDGRNLDWMEFMKLQDLSGTSFVAVGLAHYTGPKSLLKLFQKQGYRVRRLLF